MRKVFVAWFATAGVLLLFDACSALWVEKLLGPESVLWLTFLIYFATAYEGARLGNYRLAVAFAVLMSILDGTAGLGLEALLGAPVKYSFLEWVYTMVFYSGVAAILGLCAGGLVALTRPRKES